MIPNADRPSPWFEYFVRVQPRHTDYAGVVWHGSYVEWMEAARIDAFRTVGLEYADLVKGDVICLSSNYPSATNKQF